MFSRLLQKREQPQPPLSIPSPQKIAETLWQTRGCRAKAARLLGVSLRWLTEQIQTNPALSEVLWEIEENIKDIAEEKLFQRIERGNLRAIEFYLSRKGKDRGYGEEKGENRTTLVNWVSVITSQ